MSQLTFPITLWEGFEPVHTEQNRQQLIIHLKPTHQGRCACGKLAQSVHETRLRSVAERTILDYQVTLRLPHRRIVCPDCGVVTEHLSWLGPFARQTNRLIAYIETLLPLLPIKHIAELTGLHWHTNKNIDTHSLKFKKPKNKNHHQHCLKYIHQELR